MPSLIYSKSSSKSSSTGTPRWNELTAVFGGTFDPPHLGHREAVAGLFQNPGVRRVLVIPSATPPQKPQAIASEHRVAMAKICFSEHLASLKNSGKTSAGNTGSGASKIEGEVEIDTQEIDRAKRSSQPSYTFDTLHELRRDHGQLAFVLGSDQLANLPTWHRFPEVLELCHWIVLARKPLGEQIAETTLQQWQTSGWVKKEDSVWKVASRTPGVPPTITLVPTDAREISSRNIRENLAKGASNEILEASLPSEILSYLMEHRLYGTGSGRK
jgi:nicotinate-nucleotide adenylyltransferase